MLGLHTYTLLTVSEIRVHFKGLLAIPAIGDFGKARVQSDYQILCKLSTAYLYLGNFDALYFCTPLRLLGLTGSFCASFSINGTVWLQVVFLVLVTVIQVHRQKIT